MVSPLLLVVLVVLLVVWIVLVTVIAAFGILDGFGVVLLAVAVAITAGVWGSSVVLPWFWWFCYRFCGSRWRYSWFVGCPCFSGGSARGCGETQKPAVTPHHVLCSLGQRSGSP